MWDGKRISYASGKRKEVMMVVISDKIDYNSRMVRRDKAGHYIIIKTSAH